RGFDGAPAGGWYPEEKIGFEETVAAYTAGAARAAGVGFRRGVLAPGRDADLVAWQVDPAVNQNDGAAFRAGHAVLTVVGGEVVFRD
ncbi:MAG: amidohydrolase family protein, partial [Gemmatimonadales bacterium]